MVSVLNHTYPIHETVFNRSLVNLVIDHFFLLKEGGGRFFTVRTETTIMYREWKCNFSIIQQRIKYIIFNYGKKPMHPFYLTTKLCDRALIRVKKKSSKLQYEWNYIMKLYNCNGFFRNWHYSHISADKRSWRPFDHNGLNVLQKLFFYIKKTIFYQYA